MGPLDITFLTPSFLKPFFPAEILSCDFTFGKTQLNGGVNTLFYGGYYLSFSPRCSSKINWGRGYTTKYMRRDKEAESVHNKKGGT